jgi:hypothetical protein
MSKSTLRSIGTQLASATAGAVAAVALMGGGFAFAQEAPETGAAVAEVAAANSVDSAAIINGSVTGSDIANTTIGRQDLKANVVARWAKVNAGVGVKLLRGRGVESAFRGGVGVYRVVFTDPVDLCGWTVARNDNSTGTALPGHITVESAVGTPTDLIVRTFSPTGVAQDTQETDGFTVTVDC